jgi:hypothetical protein
MPDHENGEESGIKLARFCRAANALTLVDDRLNAVSQNGGCNWSEVLNTCEYSLIRPYCVLTYWKTHVLWLWAEK